MFAKALLASCDWNLPYTLDMERDQKSSSDAVMNDCSLSNGGPFNGTAGGNVAYGQIGVNSKGEQVDPECSVG